MIELISIIASLAICILIPIEVGKIRSGWVRKKVAGDRPKFLAAYRSQLKLLIAKGKEQGYLTYSGAEVRLAPEAMRQLAKVPDTEPVGNSGA